MKILIATPLYPPDIAPSALYTKELARRLSERHTVTLLVYGNIPESLPHVRIITIEKSAKLFVRITRFFFALLRESWRTDVLILENGPSVEVPFVLARPLLWKNTILEMSDTVAQSHASSSLLYRTLQAIATFFAHTTHTSGATFTFPKHQPEIHPFKPYPEKEFSEYEASWGAHLAILESHMENV